PLFLQHSAPPPPLPSFPTRRSSDLALRRAIELIGAVAGGELRAPPLDLWPQPVQEKTIFLRPERVSQLLGVPTERAELERLLTSDRKSTRLNSSHVSISYAVFCLKK